MSTKTEIINCRVPKEIKMEYELIALNERRSISNVLYNILEDDLKKRKMKKIKGE